MEVSEIRNFFPADSRYSDEIRSRSTEQPLIGGAVQVLLGPASTIPKRPTPESSVAGVLVYWAWMTGNFQGQSIVGALGVLREILESYPAAITAELCDDLRTLNVRMSKVVGSYVPAKPCNNPNCPGEMLDTAEGAMCPLCGIDQPWSAYFDELVSRAV